MTWRLLREDGVTAAAGLACDEALARRAGVETSPPTLRLYTYRPHAALVGRFQDAAREVDLAACERLGVAVNRRPTGGGAILMGPDQLGVALALRRRAAGRPRELMARFSDGLVRGLAGLGIAAAFRGKNDLEVGGRKLAGLGLHRTGGGGLLFHASLLVDLDVELMTTVLRTPFEAEGREERAAIADRTTTVRALTGAVADMDEVRCEVAAGFARSFDVAIEDGAHDDSERDEARALERETYSSDTWVHQRSAVPHADGAAIRRTPGGTIEVHLALAGRTIQAARVCGDFFADAGAVADLEGRLRWHPSDADALAATVAGWARAWPATTLGSDAVADAVAAAARDAGDPYGCFVTPEAARA